jgi:hypothetical protein
MTFESPRRTPSLAFPLVLIALGVVFLLANAGYMGRISWMDVAQLWPVLLVILGLDLLLRPRSVIVAAIVEIAIIGVALFYLAAGTPNLPGMNPINTDTFTSQESVLRTGASSLSLTLGYGAGDLTVRAGPTDAVMPNLVMVKSTREDIDLQWNVRSTGSAIVDVKSAEQDPLRGITRAWDVTVPSDMPVGLTLNLGAGDFDLDLSNVMLTEATINNGASNLEIALPRPNGNVPITVSTGASSVDLRIPAGVEYRVRVTGALNSISGPEESSGYGSATNRLTIAISSGVSSITIH